MQDLYSRRVVGWAFDTHIRESLILEARDMAVSGRDIQEGALLHTYRVVHFRGHEYEETLKMRGIRSSMSRKGTAGTML
ncbi:MAG: DDE-type integrase/transposase/recombinase [Pedobacter sp.]